MNKKAEEQKKKKKETEKQPQKAHIQAATTNIRHT